MAKLKLVLDSLEDVDKDSRDLYVEKDGKFHLDVDGVEDTSSLKGALSKERKAREELQKTVRRWEKLGKSDEEIADLIEAAAKAEEDKANKAGEWDKLKAKMVAKHEADIKAERDKTAAMQKMLEHHLVDAAAATAIASAKGTPELLLPHVQRQVRVVEEHGEFSVKVVDARGEPRVNAKGDPLSIAELVSEMRQSEIFGRAFEGTGQSGSGTRPSNGGGGNPPVKRRSEFKDERERADFVNAHGVEAYRALPA